MLIMLNHTMAYFRYLLFTVNNYLFPKKFERFDVLADNNKGSQHLLVTDYSETDPDVEEISDSDDNDEPKIVNISIDDDLIVDIEEGTA